MTHDPRCPSCGHVNQVEAAECSQCHFPLRELDAASAPAASAPSPAPAREKQPEAPATTEEKPVEISMQRIRPIRPRRPTGREQTLQLQLWLILGSLAVAAVLWTAWQGFQKNNAAQQPVEGATTDQQHAADVARAAVASDSTNINAQIALADVLYDTANWSEAIIHYRSALRLDPSRVTTIVDMGVCYYNLAQNEEAESLFKQALKLDPDQPIALFNLGVVAEGREEWPKALDYYHHALRVSPNSKMGEALSAAVQRVMQKMGKTAPALPPGASTMPGGMPGGMPPTNK